MKKIKTFILSHKIISILLLLILLTGSYFLFIKKNNGEVSYITEEVKEANITTIVSGTGQVEALNTIDLKPKVTGDIVYVGVKTGESVKKGKLIASVDSRDAKNALENAQISLAKLTKDPDSLTLLQKENSIDESYNSAWSEISSYMTDTNLLVQALKTIFDNDGFLGYKNASNLNNTGRAKIKLAEDSYYLAESSIEDITDVYKTLTRTSNKSDIDKLLNQTYESSKIISNAVKNTEDAFNYVSEYLEKEGNSDATSTRTQITSWLDTSNSFVNSLLSSLNNIKESNESLKDILSGTDELDIRSAELSVQSKIDAYNDCFIHAPFDGIVATLTAKVGQSSGTSVGTLITKQKTVIIPFNEVDVSSIKQGQKSVLTLDAIDGLKLDGTVVEIDEVGTVSSGVVTYNVKIVFNDDDERIKPGMSVSADIITNQKNNVLSVSNSSVKTRQGETYVEILNENNLPIRKKVVIGISDDSTTEIVSGLSLGEKIISRTTTNVNAQSETPSILNSIGPSQGRGAAGGAIRMRN